MPSSLIYLFYDCFVTIDKALNHLHVLGVGTMEDVNDVAHEERYHAKQHIPQGIIQYGQCQRQAFDYTGGEIDERHG